MLQTLKAVFQKLPVHFLLLPVFFIFSKYVQYEGLLDVYAAWKSGLLITGALATGLLIFFFFLKDFLKAAAAATCTGFLLLFFGDLREGLQHSSSFHFLSLYKIFLPVLTVLLFALFMVLRKSKTAYKTTLFLNLLLLIYTGVEISKLIQIKKKEKQVARENIFNAVVPNSLKKKLPDIYYIVPDCYPSSSYQAEMLAANNSAFDNALMEKGFRVLPNSRSNYNRTAFSMTATFNMAYPNRVNYQKAPDAADYNRAIKNVKLAPLFEFLQKNGYDLVNLSIFDLAEKPALRKEKFLGATTSEMIFSFTFWNYFSRDIFYHWIINKKKYKRKQQQTLLTPLKKYAQQVVDSLLKQNYKSSSGPQFVYAHLSFPHFPYFYDSTGRAYSADSIYTDSMITDRKKFAGYIKYSNQQLVKIVSALLQKTKGNAVIILQSDHGLADLDATRKMDAFRNYSAFYFPDKDYRLLYDSMSNVNTFRILLNKYFGQQLPLLPDSCIYIPMR